MKTRSLILFLSTCFLFIFAPPIIANADVGPKDSLTVYVENPPKELYYLDLLTQNGREYDNFHIDGEREALNEEMLTLLYSYENEGWTPALTEGTGVPLWGNLIGEPDGSRMVHKFGYVGLPDTYRIIIVTESGNISVSNVYTRMSLQSSITYDYSTGTAAVPPVLYAYLAQFIITFALTLLLEGLVLLLFRIDIKGNWKVFLLTNFITQILLTLTVGMALVKSGSFAAYFIQFPTEILILVSETLIYIRFLSGASKKRKTAYGVVANLASWVAGFLLLNYMFVFLSGML